jgi:hypothetical protein
MSGCDNANITPTRTRTIFTVMAIVSLQFELSDNVIVELAGDELAAVIRHSETIGNLTKDASDASAVPLPFPSCLFQLATQWCLLQPMADQAHGENWDGIVSWGSRLRFHFRAPERIQAFFRRLSATEIRSLIHLADFLEIRELLDASSRALCLRIDNADDTPARRRLLGWPDEPWALTALPHLALVAVFQNGTRWHNDGAIPELTAILGDMGTRVQRFLRRRGPGFIEDLMGVATGETADWAEDVAFVESLLNHPEVRDRLGDNGIEGLIEAVSGSVFIDASTFSPSLPPEGTLSNSVLVWALQNGDVDTIDASMRKGARYAITKQHAVWGLDLARWNGKHERLRHLIRNGLRIDLEAVAFEDPVDAGVVQALVDGEMERAGPSMSVVRDKVLDLAAVQGFRHPATQIVARLDPLHLLDEDALRKTALDALWTAQGDVVVACHLRLPAARWGALLDLLCNAALGEDALKILLGEPDLGWDTREGIMAISRGLKRAISDRATDREIVAILWDRRVAAMAYCFPCTIGVEDTFH